MHTWSFVEHICTQTHTHTYTHSITFIISHFMSSNAFSAYLMVALRSCLSLSMPLLPVSLSLSVRMESTEKCDVVIQNFNGKFLKTPPGMTGKCPLLHSCLGIYTEHSLIFFFAPMDAHYNHSVLVVQ